MTLLEFTSAVTIISAEDAYGIRQRYIQTFIDTDTTFYKTSIERLEQFRDGLCYTGYLWDCLRKPYTVISVADAIARIQQRRQVFALWDIHSAERILVPDYWKFPKDTVLQVKSNTLTENLRFLPEDLYLCDDSLSWTVILTHESNSDNSRICINKGGTGTVATVPAPRLSRDIRPPERARSKNRRRLMKTVV